MIQGTIDQKIQENLSMGNRLEKIQEAAKKVEDLTKLTNQFPVKLDKPQTSTSRWGLAK